MDNLEINENTVKQAVEGLRALNKKYLKKITKKKLLDDESKPTMFLQVTLKKIPNLSGYRMLKIPLPHSLLQEPSDVCLITGDLDVKNKRADSELTVAHYRDLLDSHGVDNIKEILAVRQIRTEYKAIESRRRLYAAYDFFLCDNRITALLPVALGKHFFKKRKFPIQINLLTSNLKQQIDNALSCTVLYINGRGNTGSAAVANLGLKNKDIVENVLAAIKVIAEKIEGTWHNIDCISIKTEKSISFPLFVSYAPPRIVRLKETEQPEVIEEEIDSLVNRKIKFYPTGDIRIQRVDTDEEESEHEFEQDILGNDVKLEPSFMRMKQDSAERKKKRKQRALEGDEKKLKVVKVENRKNRFSRKLKANSEVKKEARPQEKKSKKVKNESA